MSVREKISEKPAIGMGIGIGMVVVAVASLAYTGRDTSVRPPEEAFFTIDDGKTWFAAGIDNIPPFPHEGKVAVRAFVFECNGTKSVHYLQRYTEDARKRILAAQGKSVAEISSAMQGAALSGLETKKPGADKWVRVTDKSATAITRVTCPDGSPALAVDP